MRRSLIAARSGLLMLGCGGLAVDRAWVTWKQILSAAVRLRKLSLGSTCWMTSENGIFLGDTAKLRSNNRTLCLVSVSGWLLRLITVSLVPVGVVW